MNCKICGKELEPGATVCKCCGAKVGGTARKSKKGKSRQRIANAVLLVILILMIAAIAFGLVKLINFLTDDTAADATSVSDTVDEEDTEDTEDTEDAEEAAASTAEADTGTKTAEDTAKPAETEKTETEDTAEETKPAETDAQTETGTEEGTKADTDSDTTGTEKTEEPAAATQPTSEYTIGVDKNPVKPSVNHYRELSIYINETLPSGVTVKSIELTSEDTSIATTEMVDGLGRVWGVKAGETNVVATVTLSNNKTVTRTIPVVVGETQQTPGSVSYNDGSYVLPNSDTKQYTQSELSGLSDWELTLARNEIFARHGYIFTSTSIKEYFEGKSWYTGKYTKDQFDYSWLNSTELANIKTIQAVESSR